MFSMQSLMVMNKLKMTEQENDEYIEKFYLAFENKFRGTEAEIKSRQSVYLPFVKSAVAKTMKSVVDIGCGRGEFLSLLMDNDLGASSMGVDSNIQMVSSCESKGFRVVHGDALWFLDNCKDNQLGAITGFHIIEHMQFKDLLLMMREAYRVLNSGGVAIFETPNPRNLWVGACQFYTDPTHNNPIPPHTAEFMMQYVGFKTSILELHPRGNAASSPSEAEKMLAHAQDYAVIGHKA